MTKFLVMVIIILCYARGSAAQIFTGNTVTRLTMMLSLFYDGLYCTYIAFLLFRFLICSFAIVFV